MQTIYEMSNCTDGYNRDVVRTAVYTCGETVMSPPPAMMGSFVPLLPAAPLPFHMSPLWTPHVHCVPSPAWLSQPSRWIHRLCFLPFLIRLKCSTECS